MPFVAAQVGSGGQRKLLVAGYCNGMNWEDPSDVRLFMNALQTILIEADRMHNVMLDATYPAWTTNTANEAPKHPLSSLFDELNRCGYKWDGKVLVGVTASARLDDAKVYASTFELGHLGEHINRIERAIEADPAQAIGSAKELAEAVPTTILNKRNVTFSPSADLIELGKLTFRALKQVPDNVPDHPSRVRSITPSTGVRHCRGSLRTDD